MKKITLTSIQGINRNKRRQTNLSISDLLDNQKGMFAEMQVTNKLIKQHTKLDR